MSSHPGNPLSNLLNLRFPMSDYLIRPCYGTIVGYSFVGLVSFLYFNRPLIGSIFFGLSLLSLAQLNELRSYPKANEGL
jgi:hypothetical protein